MLKHFNLINILISFLRQQYYLTFIDLLTFALAQNFASTDAKVKSVAGPLADLKGGEFEVSSDSDVADDIHAIMVGELDFLSIRKLHFKQVSIQLQSNLEKTNSITLLLLLLLLLIYFQYYHTKTVCRKCKLHLCDLEV